MNEVKIHVKAEDHASKDMDVIGKKVEVAAKRSFAKTGGHAGAAFAAGFIKTVTFGMVGSGFAQTAVRMAPKMAHIGGVLGAGLAAGLVMQAVKAVGAVLPLALGAIMAAGPVMYLMKFMLNAEEQAKKSATRVDSLRKRYAAASDKDVKKRLRDELKIAEEEEFVWRIRAEHWTDLKKKAKSFMDYISQPFQIPLANSMKAIGTWMEKNKKLFKGISKEIAPALEPLTKGALKGVTNFLKEIDWESVGSGMKAWGDAMPGIGKSLGKLVNKILEDPKGTVDAVKGLAQGIEDIGKAAGDAWENLSKFTKAYDDFASSVDKHENSDLGGDSWLLPQPATVRKQANAVVKVFRGFVSRMGAVASSAGEHIAGPFKELWGKIGPSVRAVVSKAVSVMRGLPGKVTGAIRSLGNKIEKVWDDAYNATVKGAKSIINGAVRILKTLASKAKSALSNVKGKIQAAFSNAGTWLVSAGKKVINGLISGIKSKAGSIIGSVKSVIPDALEKYLPFAHGGMVGAASGGNRGSRVLVGEQGPEIVDLPFGSHVNSNADSRRIAGGGGRGGVTININAPGVTDTNGLRRMLVDMHRRGELDVVLR